MEKRSQASGIKSAQRSRGNVQRIVVRCALCVALPVLSLAFTFTIPGEKDEKENEQVRKAAVAGVFYPDDKQTLQELVDALLRQADTFKLPGPVRAIMVPHAGYVYSGLVAACAYKAIEGQDIKTVILMCNSHRQYLDGIAVYKKGSFETPLGRVPIDEEKVAKLLAASPKIMDRSDAHEADHVLEVQLPFLQRALKDFKIVPLLFGNDDLRLPGILANALKDIVDDKTLIVASTDMSHYPPYEAANTSDRATINAILTGKTIELDKALAGLEQKGVPQAETFLCGVSGVKTAMLLAEAEGATDIKLLKYANSGDTAGDKRRVVGYSAIAFVKPSPLTPSLSPGERPGEGEKKESTPGVNSGETNPGELNASEQTELLKLAQTTVENFVRTGKIPSYSPSSPKLETPLGVFVTLREHGELRGCIGRFEPSEPLYKIVQQMAMAAASEDPRFRPIREDELEKLEYEISVLSPLKKVKNADEIVIGKHGVQVSKGFFNRGVFLPQVATETGWSKEEFLGELCSQKAGLPRSCWKDPSVKLEVFTAQVFPEEKK